MKKTNDMPEVEMLRSEIEMLMADRESIRDTIAFPKSASAACLMDGSPGEVEPATLKELRLKVEQ